MFTRYTSLPSSGLIVSEVGDKFSFPPASDGFLLGLFFNPEDLGDTFLRIIELPPNYKSLQPIIQHSSWSSP
jgi:hypothetical protein